MQYAWEKLFRIAMVNEEVDIDKIFFTGISEGGYGSQRLRAFYADYLAGVGPHGWWRAFRKCTAIKFSEYCLLFSHWRE